MVLVVLGYDQNKEGLVGSSWAVNPLELAKVKGLMKGLDNFDANHAHAVYGDHIEELKMICKMLNIDVEVLGD